MTSSVLISLFFLFYTYHFSAPGRAVGPVCVSVYPPLN